MYNYIILNWEERLMKNRVAALILCIVCCFALSGCDILSPQTDELLSPPQLTGEMFPIEQALKESVKEQYTLKYPSHGEQRSAVMLQDINNDGEEEAFVFYSTSNDDLTTMHINAIVRDGKKWKSAAVQNIIASGLEKVEFCDLDGDGIKEIVVGWEIYAQSEKQVAVYSLQRKQLIPRLMQHYTSFLCCDLDQNGSNELFIHDLNTADSKNIAALYAIEDTGNTQIAGCIMDNKVSEANKPILSTLKGGVPAIYIDETKGVAAVTEVLYMSGGKLVNSLLDTANSMENISTVRPASIYCKDMDGDGALEIPIASELPNADSTSVEKLYYTNWCSFDGQTLTQTDVTIVNTADGYMLDIPDKWLGNIAVAKDTEKRTRTVYSYDPETNVVGVKIVTFKVVDEKEWNKKNYDKKDTVEISRSGGYVYCATPIAYDGELAVSEQAIIKMFAFIG